MRDSGVTLSAAELHQPRRQDTSPCQHGGHKGCLIVAPGGKPVGCEQQHAVHGAILVLQPACHRGHRLRSRQLRMPDAQCLSCRKHPRATDYMSVTKRCLPSGTLPHTYWYSSRAMVEDLVRSSSRSTGCSTMPRSTCMTPCLLYSCSTKGRTAGSAPVEPQQRLREGGEGAEDHDQARPHAGGALPQEEQLPRALERPPNHPSIPCS